MLNNTLTFELFSKHKEKCGKWCWTADGNSTKWIRIMINVGDMNYYSVDNSTPESCKEMAKIIGWLESISLEEAQNRVFEYKNKYLLIKF